jgi:hypothetical protein
MDAAYAECGKFDDAIALATKVRELARTSDQQEVVQAAEQRLAAYRLRQPYRQPPSNAPN